MYAKDIKKIRKQKKKRKYINVPREPDSAQKEEAAHGPSSQNRTVTLSFLFHG
jgi:hypothetical protein